MDIREKLKIYLDENLEVPKMRFSKMKMNNFFAGSAKASSAPMMDMELCESCASIDNYIDKELDENKFQKLLFSYIDRNNLKDSDVYNKAFIDRRLFSKIRSDENYHPSKETVISLACSLELSVDELEELLKSASYSLPKNNKFDLIIRFCFLEKIYDIMEVNNLLSEYRCNLLTK